MTPEVVRRHYLEAMGITAWASRYQLPNARPTETCEWDDTPATPTPPRERLQALLDDVPAPRSAPAEAQTASDEVTASPAAVRALLEEHQAPLSKPEAAAPAAVPTPSEAPVAKEPLQFGVSCVCIGRRWLSIHAGEIDASEQRLLANICQAVGLAGGSLPEVMFFKWPPMANAFEPEDPLEEAREGVNAFISGAAIRQQWQLEKILLWGADATDPDSASLAKVLDVDNQQSRTLELPVWQAPSLATLLHSADAKRNLWPALHALAQDWPVPDRDDH
ncbi:MULTISPECIES: hypothetical protein [Halomonadaceae]|uniref:hypothetical protein n=1 Tax=Halomonadaceae TaxID=28256 RepID=UPI000A284F87|nr:MULTISPECIES: hypothetical protein [Halomonas]MCW4150188.1 hypothetical protein [Halomonas sp. 18H]MDR5887626.1 hypothetical protein [Halomonas janggokensis]QPL46678.1 hypothetical protein IT895_02360 [Halomonas sp. A40-4]